MHLAIPYVVEPSEDIRMESKEAYVANLIRLIHSPLVLEQVLSRPEIGQIESLAQANKPVSLLSERIDVSWDEKSEIIIVSCYWTNPEEAAKIANAVVESYFRAHTQDVAQQSTWAVELLEDIRAATNVTIQQLESQLVEMKKASGVNPNKIELQLMEQSLRASYLRYSEQEEEIALQLAELKIDSEGSAEGKSEDQNSAEAESNNKQAQEPATSSPTLELKRKAIAVRKAEVVAELTKLENWATEPDIIQREQQLQLEREFKKTLTKRIFNLRAEMHNKTKITLLRKAEPPTGTNDDDEFGP